MSNFTQIVTGLPFMLVMFTLLITLIGVFVARRANIQSNEPWSLTHLENGLWLLKRKGASLATIHGIVVEEPENIETPQIEGLGFSFTNPANKPDKFFKTGSSSIIRIDERMAEAKFILYYEEYKNRKDLPEEGNYSADKIDELEMPSNVKTWKTDIHH